MSVSAFAQETAARIGTTVSTLSASAAEGLEDEILAADRVFVVAAGRSLLAVKFFAMRLMQIGITCFVVGEVTTPSVRNGDLLLVVSGSGETRGLMAVAEKARSAGARVAVVTENESSTLGRFADRVMTIAVPDTAGEDADFGVVPHGNYLEPTVIVVLDAVVCDLMLRTQVTVGTLLSNHANLE